jgi:hypothetical protein
VVVRFKDSWLEGAGYREGEVGRRHLNGGNGRGVERLRLGCQAVARDEQVRQQHRQQGGGGSTALTGGRRRGLARVGLAGPHGRMGWMIVWATSCLGQN